MSRFRSFAPALVYALLILSVGSLPSLTVSTPFALDKLAHFTMYAGLGALLAFGMVRARVAASLTWPLLAGALVGALDELHQRTVLGRSAEWADFMADLAGCALALWLVHRVLVRRAAPGTAAPDDDGAPLSKTIQEHRA